NFDSTMNTTTLSAEKSHLPALFCFSHLRWDFVFQRPQHLMTRFTKTHRVFVIEEPMPDEGYGRWDINASPDGVTVCVPRIPAGLDDASTTRIMQRLVRELAVSNDAVDCVAWFYTPMMFEWG